MTASCDKLDEVCQEEETKPKFKGFTRLQITTEPVFLLVMFPITFTSGINIDLYQRQACNVIQGTSSIDCKVAGNTSHALEISYVSSQVSMVNMVVSQICPLFIMLFVGPWSDLNGRKPFIVLPFLGYLLSFIMLTVMSCFPRLDPMWFVIPAIPISLTGTLIVQYLCLFAYICDVFPEEERSLRFSISWSLSQVGMAVANLTVSPIFDASGRYGYQVVFLICVATSFLGFLYSQFLLEETVLKKQKSYTGLFNLSYAKEVARAVLIEPTKGRLRVMFNIIIIFSVVSLFIGELKMDYLIGQIQYSWPLATYNIYSVTTMFVSAISTAAVPWTFRNVFKMGDTTIIMVSGILLLISELVKALAPNQITFWVASMVNRQYSLIAPMTKALMSNSVDSEDLGKLYSFTGLEELIASSLGTPLFTGVYNLFLPSRRVLLTYILPAFLGLAVTVSSLSLLVLDTRDKKYMLKISTKENGHST